MANLPAPHPVRAFPELAVDAMEKLSRQTVGYTDDPRKAAWNPRR